MANWQPHPHTAFLLQVCGRFALVLLLVDNTCTAMLDGSVLGVAAGWLTSVRAPAALAASAFFLLSPVATAASALWRVSCALAPLLYSVYWLLQPLFRACPLVRSSNLAASATLHLLWMV